VRTSTACTLCLAGPSELAQPGYSLWSAFLVSLATYLLVPVAGLLSEAEALALVTSVLVGHAVAAEITGRPLDFTEPFARLFHLVGVLLAAG
jgi:hypothetical protein